MRYVALDFETANSSHVSACAVGLSVFEDTRLTGSRAYLLQPPPEYGVFQWYNTRVHGIRKSMVANAPRFDQIWPELQPVLEGSVLVCHNAAFDTSVLCKTLLHYRLPLPHCRYICTVQVSQKVWPAFSNHKLDTVASELEISLHHHEAGSDARASGLILQAAMRRLACADAEELAARLEMRLGVISPERCSSCSRERRTKATHSYQTRMQREIN